MIVAFRVDERLIHGQIITSWLKSLSVTHLLVANDEIARDPPRQKILKVVLPSEIKCLIKSIDDVIELLKDERVNPMRIMLIVGNPQDAVKIAKEISSIKEVNIANFGSITKPDGKNKISVSGMVYLDQDDVIVVNELINMELKVFTQKTPSDRVKIITKIT